MSVCEVKEPPPDWQVIVKKTVYFCSPRPWMSREQIIFFFMWQWMVCSVRACVRVCGRKGSEGWRFQGLFCQLSRMSRLLQDSSTKVSQGFIIATVAITIPAASDTSIVTQKLGMKFSTLEKREAYRSFILYSFGVTILWNCYFCKVSAGRAHQ